MRTERAGWIGRMSHAPHLGSWAGRAAWRWLCGAGFAAALAVTACAQASLSAAPADSSNTLPLIHGIGTQIIERGSVVAIPIRIYPGIVLTSLEIVPPPALFASIRVSTTESVDWLFAGPVDRSSPSYDPNNLVIGIRASDGVHAQVVEFQIIEQDSLPPRQILAAIPDQTVPAGSPFFDVPFQVIAPDPDAVHFLPLFDSAQFDRVEVLGSGSSQHLRFYPKPGATGPTLVQLWGSNGADSELDSFLVAFRPPEPPRAVPFPAPQYLSFIVPVNALSHFELPIEDPDTPASELKCSVQHSIPDMIRLATVTAVANKLVLNIATTAAAAGRAPLTLTVTDGIFTNAFYLTVFFDTPANDPPVFLPMAAIVRGAPEATADSVMVDFSDADTTRDSFTLTADSTHHVIKWIAPDPNGQPKWPLSAAFDFTATFHIERIPGATGADLVTLSISDGTHVAQKTFTYAVGAAGPFPQVITFEPAPSLVYSDAPVPLLAAASSGLPVQFQVVSGPVTLTTNGLRLEAAGTAVIRALQTGDDSFSAADPIERTITIRKAAQTIAFPSIPAGQLSVQLQATASSGLAPVLEVISGPATLADGQLTITGPGKVTVKAEQPGDARYEPAPPALFTYVGQKRTQTIEAADLPALRLGDPPVPLSATASSGLPVTFQITAGPAHILGGLLAIAGAGTVNLRISQNGNDEFEPTALQRSLFIGRRLQTLAFTPPHAALLSPTNLTLAAAASSGLTVTFQIVSGPAFLTDNTLTFTGAGEVVIRAAQTGNDFFEPAAPVERTIMVISMPQLSLRPTGSAFVLDLTLTDDFILESASSIDGAWTPLPSAVGSTSLAVPSQDIRRFFRLRAR